MLGFQRNFMGIFIINDTCINFLSLHVFDEIFQSYGPLLDSALHIAYSSCLHRNYLTIWNILMKLNSTL